MRVALSAVSYASITVGEVSRTLEGLYPGRLQADPSKHLVCLFFERIAFVNGLHVYRIGCYGSDVPDSVSPRLSARVCPSARNSAQERS